MLKTVQNLSHLFQLTFNMCKTCRYRQIWLIRVFSTDSTPSTAAADLILLLLLYSFMKYALRLRKKYRLLIFHKTRQPMVKIGASVNLNKLTLVFIFRIRYNQKIK